MRKIKSFQKLLTLVKFVSWLRILGIPRQNIDMAAILEVIKLHK